MYFRRQLHVRYTPPPEPIVTRRERRPRRPGRGRRPRAGRRGRSLGEQAEPWRAGETASPSISARFTCARSVAEPGRAAGGTQPRLEVSSASARGPTTRSECAYLIPGQSSASAAAGTSSARRRSETADRSNTSAGAGRRAGEARPLRESTIKRSADADELLNSGLPKGGRPRTAQETRAAREAERKDDTEPWGGGAWPRTWMCTISPARSSLGCTAGDALRDLGRRATSASLRCSGA